MKETQHIVQRTDEAVERVGEELLARIHEGFVPLVQGIPGFISYTAIADPASQTQAFIGLFEDKAGADESNRLAADWLADNEIDDFEGDPVVAEGDIAFTIA